MPFPPEFEEMLAKVVADFDDAWWKNESPRPEDYASAFADPAQRWEAERRLRRRQAELSDELNRRNRQLRTRLEQLRPSNNTDAVRQILQVLCEVLNEAVPAVGFKRSRFLREFLLRAFWYLFRQGVTPPQDDFQAQFSAEEDQATLSAAYDHFSRAHSWRFRPTGRVIATGGQGEILEGRDDALDRTVILKRALAEPGQNDDRERRLEREARMTASLDHPGVPTVFGIGRDGNNRLYVAMEFIDGQTLKDHIRRFHRISIQTNSPANPVAAFPDHEAAVPPEDAPPPALARSLVPRHRECRRRNPRFLWLLRRFLAVCEIVGYVHRQGILHRDLKPKNIMIGRFGVTYVIDWGLGKRREGAELPAGMANPAWGDLTQASDRPGTPEYMSPEQAESPARLLTPAADVYSLGATLYELLTGGRPADWLPVQVLKDKVKEVIRRKGMPGPAADLSPDRTSSSEDLLGDRLKILVERRLGRDADPLSVQRQVNEVRIALAISAPCLRPRAINRRIDPELERICLRAMAHEPENRYPDAAAFARALDRWLRDLPQKEHELAQGPWWRRLRTGVPRLLGRLRTGVPRWLRRHPTLATLGIVITVVSCVLAVLASQAYWEYQKRTEIEEQNNESIKVLNHLAQLCRQANATPQFRAQVRQQIREHYEKFLKKAANQPTLLFVDARKTVADIYMAAGNPEQAEVHLGDAVKDLEQLVKQAPQDKAIIKTLAETYHNLADVQAQLQHIEDAHATYDKALGQWQRLEQMFPDGDKDEALRGQARVWGYRGDMYWERYYRVSKARRDIDQARGDYDQSHTVRANILEDAHKLPANQAGRKERLDDAKRQLAQSCCNLARTEWVQWRIERYQRGQPTSPNDPGLKEGKTHYQKALNYQRELSPEDKADVPDDYRNELGDCLRELGRLRLALGELEEAEKDFLEAVAIFDALLKKAWLVDYAQSRIRAVMGAVRARHGRGVRHTAELWKNLGEPKQITELFRSFEAQGFDARSYRDARNDYEEFKEIMRIPK